jgi:hypothetical protein
VVFVFQVDKRTMLDNLELILLTIDEVVSMHFLSCCVVLAPSPVAPLCVDLDCCFPVYEWVFSTLQFGLCLIFFVFLSFKLYVTLFSHSFFIFSRFFYLISNTKFYGTVFIACVCVCVF